MARESKTTLFFCAFLFLLILFLFFYGSIVRQNASQIIVIRPSEQFGTCGLALRGGHIRMSMVASKDVTLTGLTAVLISEDVSSTIATKESTALKANFPEEISTNAPLWGTKDLPVLQVTLSSTLPAETFLYIHIFQNATSWLGSDFTSADILFANYSTETPDEPEELETSTS
uniref:Uncharacterized protein n=1 Tax=Palpitomonas bilix TaxID=652834 RepID=A0A7S3DBM7_9EUKA|mmetsp:Transcript_30570/g.79729  ORF Transcript_30570/g.79729 Transcript_30570/m.79729 type:complete len:173 (+) Transcript_30570:227-745(+)